MKLIRYGEPNKEKTGVILGDVPYDTSAFGEDYNEQFFETEGIARLEKFRLGRSARSGRTADRQTLTNIAQGSPRAGLTGAAKLGSQTR